VQGVFQIALIKMIIREKLVMEKIDYGLYSRLLEMLNWTKTDVKPGPNSSFTRITTPLIYDSFFELLFHFKETDMARRASVMVWGGDWYRVESEEIDYHNAGDLEDIANDSGSMILSFRSMERDWMYKNNEIRFDKIGGAKPKIVSTSLEMPWEDRFFCDYKWQGSISQHEQSKTIYGIINPRCYFKILKDALS
jgi:hypothetical protein